MPFLADSGSGDLFGLDWDDPTLIVPDAYVSLNPLEGTSIWEDETFDSLGLAFGSYTWSWGSGEGESFTLDVVPEPSTAILMSLGLVGLAARRRRA
jgi:hypothetical protein